MEAISKKSGKKFTGNVATLMIRIGVATPVDEEIPEVPDAVEVPKSESDDVNQVTAETEVPDTTETKEEVIETEVPEVPDAVEKLTEEIQSENQSDSALVIKPEKQKRK